jgi:hypothetical protein
MMTEFHGETFDELQIPNVIEGPSPELAEIYQEYGRAAYERSFNVDGEQLLARRNAAAESKHSAWLAGVRKSGQLASLLHSHGEYEPLSMGEIAARASAAADHADRIDEIKSGIADGSVGFIDTGSMEAQATETRQQRANYEFGYRSRREAVRDELVRRLPGARRESRRSAGDESLHFRNGGPIIRRR